MTAKLLEITVGDIMTSPVVVIDVNQRVSDAHAAMTKGRVRKILVIQDGSPKGLLEDWMADKMDASKTLKDAFEELGVAPSPVEIVGPETPVDAITDRFGEVAALVIMDVTGPAKIAGIVTATDLYKARPRFSA